MDNNRDYVSTEFPPYQTGKKLFALESKLKKNEQNPIMVHDGKIGITIQDYSNGTGDKNVIVRANINPSDVSILKKKMDAIEVMKHFKYTNRDELLSQSKIFGLPMTEGPYTGLCKVTKLFITRNPIINNEPARFPISVTVENGYGKKNVRENGATMIAPNSYQKDKSATIQMSDDDFSSQIYAVENHIKVFDIMYGGKILYPLYDNRWTAASNYGK